MPGQAQLEDYVTSTLTPCESVLPYGQCMSAQNVRTVYEGSREATKLSRASSPQAPALTASNGQCMLPSAIVLHSEACFARQKRPREENSTPPKWPPRTDNKSLRDSSHLVRLGQSMELSMALKVADQVEYTAGARYALSACGYAIRPCPPLNIHKATPLCSQTSLKASGGRRFMFEVQNGELKTQEGIQA